jgi:hypothetical protein
MSQIVPGSGMASTLKEPPAFAVASPAIVPYPTSMVTLLDVS